MSILLAAFATTGFQQVFVKEILGSAFDSQAEHFLHGDVDVPDSETFLSVVWCSSWLLPGAIIGIAYLFQRKRSD